MEPQAFSEIEAHLYPHNILIEDGNCGDTPSSQNHITLHKPVKKPTRQWAAWTRQEEESFFSALRQVGKNFEKITCRVQSKNKDQVRHYYYRLVRRMNKLLGPELSLDAKNSKETNAAMLRWWSLLEKYSCKASKLHLKPRRFKIFIETLEHQLLKDRKKNTKKRRSQGETYVSTASATVSSQNRASGHDTQVVEVLIESQSMQKLGPVKGSSFKRNLGTGITRAKSKGDSCVVRTVRQRQKSGTVSMAAYKRWEKAAIAGVSLVADAAEHLERTVTEIDNVGIAPGNNGIDHVGEDNPPLLMSPHNLFNEKCIQTPIKLKLQLFPIDEDTRRALELDNHNPYLELTLSTRKKISSVLDHLNRKWGDSSVASGKLMLFPYCIQRENMVDYQSWTQDSVISAADVYASIGSPAVFRLRYGWFSNSEPPLATCQESLPSSRIPSMHNVNMDEQIVNSIPVTTSHNITQSEKLIDHCKDRLVAGSETTASLASSTFVSDKKVGCIEHSDHATNTSWLQRDPDDGATTRQVGFVDDRRLINGSVLSPREWADSLTNISIGDLLSETAQDMNAICIDPTLSGPSLYAQQIPFSCDSFDAAIAAHIYRHQSKTAFQPALAPSIWDAEETCDAFSFQKSNVFLDQDHQSASPVDCKELARSSEGTGAAAIKGFPEAARPMDEDPAPGDPIDAPPLLDNSLKDLNGLTDIYWPDSLGPLDLDIIPSCRYHSEDLILSDSLSGLNRLVANSLDAFQSCAFLSLDKKEVAPPPSTIEARDTSSTYKNSSED